MDFQVEKDDSGRLTVSVFRAFTDYASWSTANLNLPGYNLNDNEFIIDNRTPWLVSFFKEYEEFFVDTGTRIVDCSGSINYTVYRYVEKEKTEFCYVVFNNDAPITVWGDEEQAVHEVLRLKSQQTDVRFCYHHRRVKRG